MTAGAAGRAATEINTRGRYRPLDGIRALAVLAVVAAHSHLRIAHGGGYGVDIFFVLSGYLITGLLLRELETTETVDRRAFYLRRALRLLPALLITVVWTVILDLTAKLGGGHMAAAAPATIFYYGNWLVAANGQALGFLGQTWSLSIEEQFYIVWPLLLLIPAVRRRILTWLPIFIAVMWVGRIVAYAILGGAVMAWTPFRADELAIGALLAAWNTAGRPLPRALTSLSAAAVAVLVVAALVVPSTPDRLAAYGGVDIVALATAVVIAHVTASRESVVSRVLGWRPLAAVGLVSYGIYLYHYAILLWLFGRGYGTAETIAIAWPVIAALVVGSWFLVERPALRLKGRFERVRTLPRPASPSPGHPSPSAT